MGKVILKVLLAVVSCSAVAEWVVVGKAENITVYADPASIHINGSIAGMQYLADLKMALNTDDGKPYMSTKAQDEFDCKEGKHRTRSLSCYTGNMGNGDVVCTYSGQSHEAWHQVVPKSINETMWKLSCGKP